MSEIRPLNELIGGANNASINTTQEKVADIQETSALEQQQPVMVDRSGEGARDLHSQTPHSSLDNLSALVNSMDEDLEEAKAIYEEKVRQEELEEISQEKENKSKDEVVEVDYSEEPSKEKTVNDIKPESRLVEDDSLSKIKVLKFKKNDQANNAYKALLEKRAKEHDARATQGVLCNSGYSLKMSGLRSPELLALEVNQSTTDVFTFTKFLYGKLYDHIVQTNVGKMSWETWLKNTSLLELNTLAYAAFCSTYPDVNEYPAYCSDEECRKEHGEFTHNYPNDALMYLDDDVREATSNKILEILQSKDPMELFKNADVNYNVRMKLSTGTIIELRHPSLYNQLIDTLSEMKDRNLLDTNEMLYNLMPFVEAAYIYDADQDAYMKLEDFDQKFTELTFMSDDDLAEILKAIDDIKNTYSVKFGIRNVVCPRCGKPAIDEPIDDMMSLLFFIHDRKTQQN